MVVQLGEYTKNHVIVNFKGWILWYVNINLKKRNESYQKKVLIARKHKVFISQKEFYFSNYITASANTGSLKA